MENNTAEAVVEAPVSANLPGATVDEKKVHLLVEEIVELFKPRVLSSEIRPDELASALGIALTGAVLSLVPREKLPRIEQEGDSLATYLLKQFDGRVSKRNYSFASQLLGAARFTSYVMDQGTANISAFQQVKANLK